MSNMHDRNRQRNAGKQQRHSRKPLSVEYYEILGVLDKESCPTCAAMDGARFPVANKKVGVNYPPFHDGCRCEVLDYFEGMPPLSDRVYRDPKTNKSVSGQYMVYGQWKTAMVKKYGKDVFNK